MAAKEIAPYARPRSPIQRTEGFLAHLRTSPRLLPPYNQGIFSGRLSYEGLSVGSPSFGAGTNIAMGGTVTQWITRENVEIILKPDPTV